MLPSYWRLVATKETYFNILFQRELNQMNITIDKNNGKKRFSQKESNKGKGV